MSTISYGFTTLLDNYFEQFPIDIQETIMSHVTKRQRNTFRHIARRAIVNKASYTEYVVARRQLVKESILQPKPFYAWLAAQYGSVLVRTKKMSKRKQDLIKILEDYEYTDSTDSTDSTSDSKHVYTRVWDRRFIVDAIKSPGSLMEFPGAVSDYEFGMSNHDDNKANWNDFDYDWNDNYFSAVDNLKTFKDLIKLTKAIPLEIKKMFSYW